MFKYKNYYSTIKKMEIIFEYAAGYRVKQTKMKPNNFYWGWVINFLTMTWDSTNYFMFSSTF